MNLGDHVRLRSVTFKADAAVRLPGSSQTAYYIPASDYPLRYYPSLNLVQATCKGGTHSNPGESRVRWYHASNTKDLDVDEASLPPETAVVSTADGKAMMPTAPMRNVAGGGFERVTDEEPASFDAPAAPTAQETPAAKKGGWPKGKPRPKREAAPAPTPAPQRPPMVIPPVPQVRVRAERGD